MCHGEGDELAPAVRFRGGKMVRLCCKLNCLSFCVQPSWESWEGAGGQAWGQHPHSAHVLASDTEDRGKSLSGNEENSISLGAFWKNTLLTPMEVEDVGKSLQIFTWIIDLRKAKVWHNVKILYWKQLSKYSWEKGLKMCIVF